MASNNIARLGVVLGLDTAEFTAEVDKAISVNQKMANAIKRDTNAAAGELVNLKNATQDYGRALSKVELIQRDITSGKFMNATADMKQRLLDQAAAYDRVATSQKKVTDGLTQQQKLQLTYQTTDLFTQIASGQSPFIALIQQGGQLKDTMGGVGGMFRALGTLITPFTVSVGMLSAVFGSLGIALYKSKDELDKFKDSMTLTGQFAGIAYSKFIDMGDALSGKVGASIGSTRDVLSQLVASGQFTATSIDSVAAAILKFSKISGVDATDAAKQLIPLLDGTASSARQLNDKYHFLTFEQYKYIKQLEDQGRLQEAAKFTADALKDSLVSTERNLGTLEKAWKSVKDMASGAWDAMLGIGRPPTANSLKPLEDEINKTAATIEQRRKMGLNTQTMEAELQKMRQRLSEETGKIHAEITAAEAKSKSAEANKKKIDWDAKYGMASKQKAIEFAKEEAETKYMIAFNSENELGKLTLERDKKIADARREMQQKNESEKYQFSVLNNKIFQQKQLQAEEEFAEKIRLIRRKEKIDIAKAQIEQEQSYIDMNNSYAQMVATQHFEAKEKTRLLELSKEDLELKSRMIYASEKEVQLAEIALKYNRLRESANADPVRLEQLKKQEDVEKFMVQTQETMKKTSQIFDSVWGNMSSAIDNFVRTGKLNMKDFARSVIQDLIAIQMKAAALSFLRMAFSAFGPTPASANPSQYALSAPSGSGLGIQFKAGGGAVTNSTPYIVGENGPELFVPSGSGTIIPNGQMGNASGSPSVVYNGPYIANMSAIDTQSGIQFLAKNKEAVWAANQSAQRSLPVSR